MITREQFARWSFFRDRRVGCFSHPAPKSFSKLPKEDQELYLEEADFYLGKPLVDWPIDILKRLDKATLATLPPALQEEVSKQHEKQV